MDEIAQTMLDRMKGYAKSYAKLAEARDELNDPKRLGTVEEALAWCMFYQMEVEAWQISQE
jgi:hypothetical protein